jgi:hypothetical protein
MKNDGHVEARDYKASDEVTTPEQSELRLRLYASGLKSIGKPISKACFVTLEEAEIKPVDVFRREHRQSARYYRDRNSAYHRRTFRSTTRQVFWSL